MWVQLGKITRKPEKVSENKSGRVVVVFVESSLSNSTLSRSRNATVVLVGDKIGLIRSKTHTKALSLAIRNIHFHVSTHSIHDIPRIVININVPVTYTIPTSLQGQETMASRFLAVDGKTPIQPGTTVQTQGKAEVGEAQTAKGCTDSAVDERCLFVPPPSLS